MGKKGARITYTKLLGLVTGFFLFGASAYAQEAQGTPAPLPTPKRIFRTALAGPVDSLDPALAESGSEILVMSNLVEPLLSRSQETGGLLPNAASKVTVSRDGLKITFTLREDLFWSNGKKVVAEDFAYGLRRLLQPSRRNWLAERLSVIKRAEEMLEGAILDPAQVGIQAKDSKTLVIELRKPSALILDVFCEPGTAPVHKESLERFKSSWGKPQNWVGNGPFVPVSFDENDLVLAKNPHHRLTANIAVDEVRIRWVESPAAGTDLYLRGEIDQFGLRDFSVPSNRIPRLAGRQDLFFQPDLRTFFLRLNTVRAPLSQLMLRQALAMAIDRPLLVSSVVLDGETPAYSLIPEGLRGYDPPHGYLLNILGAQKTLRDLGYCGKKKTEGVCKPVPLLTLIHPESEKKRKIALAVEAILKRNLKIDGLGVTQKSPDEFVRLVGEGDYIIALDDLAVTPDRPFGFLDAFRGGKSSAGGFSSKEFEELVKDVERSPEWNDTRAFLRRAESTLLRDGGIIPLFHGSTPILVSPAVRGYRPNIWDVHPYSEISLLK